MRRQGRRPVADRIPIWGDVIPGNTGSDKTKLTFGVTDLSFGSPKCFPRYDSVRIPIPRSPACDSHAPRAAGDAFFGGSRT